MPRRSPKQKRSWFLALGKKVRIKRWFKNPTLKFKYGIRYQDKTRLIIISLVLLSFIFGPTIMTKAATARFYSPLCLGGWKYPQNTEGEPQVPLGSDTSSYNSGNSAILEGVTGQIFCGKFQTQDSSSENINSVGLFMSLAILEKPNFIEPSDFEKGSTIDVPAGDGGKFIVPVPQTPPEPSPDEKTDDNTKANILDVIPTPLSSAEPEPSVEPLPQTTETQGDPQSTEQTPTDSDSLPVASPEPGPIPTPETIQPAEPEPTPAPPAEEPAPQPAPEESFLLDLFRVQEARADSRDTNLDDILEVSYNIDGGDWHIVGRLNRDNFKLAHFDIPVSSVEEISRIQVAVSSLPTADLVEAIYLDSIWLEAEYDSGVLSFIKDLGETILETVTLQNLGDEKPNTEEVADSIKPSESPTPQPKIKKTIYTFNVDGEVEIPKFDLDWYPKEKLESLDSFKQKKWLDTVDIRDKKGKLDIGGSCSGKYYVVMIYRNKNDYSEKPASSVYNSAFPCENGGVKQSTIEVSNLENGTYYILVAQQDDGPWEPISKIYSISITSQDVEVSE